jgi:hypothetical protein
MVGEPLMWHSGLLFFVCLRKHWCDILVS